MQGVHSGWKSWEVSLFQNLVAKLGILFLKLVIINSITRGEIISLRTYESHGCQISFKGRLTVSIVFKLHKAEKS